MKNHPVDFADENNCSVPGCIGYVRAKGWCRAHYNRWYNHGDVQADVPVRRRERLKPKKCSVEGCERGEAATGLCNSHYNRKRLYGDVFANIPFGRLQHGEETGSLALRQWLAQGAKNTACEDCGGRFPSVCMDFDHTWGEKEDGIGNIVSSGPMADLVFELAKCHVVCSNCHRIRTFITRN